MAKKKTVRKLKYPKDLFTRKEVIKEKKDFDFEWTYNSDEKNHSRKEIKGEPGREDHASHSQSNNYKGGKK